jgi:hypothetical protein
MCKNDKNISLLEDITSIASLEEAMKQNLTDCQALYDKAIKYNVINEQFFIDWQDELNRLSMQPEEELN